MTRIGLSFILVAHGAVAPSAPHATAVIAGLTRNPRQRTEPRWIPGQARDDTNWTQFHPNNPWRCAPPAPHATAVIAGLDLQSTQRTKPWIPGAETPDLIR